MSVESIDRQPHLLSNDTILILAHQLGFPPEEVRQQELLIIQSDEKVGLRPHD